VTLGQTKEAGMPMVRVADAIIGQRGGSVVNDTGNRLIVHPGGPEAAGIAGRYEAYASG
jgi:hypothetical protein